MDKTVTPNIQQKYYVSIGYWKSPADLMTVEESQNMIETQDSDFKLIQAQYVVLLSSAQIK